MKMRLIILSIIVIISFKFAFANKTDECSRENLEALVAKAGKAIGLLGAKSIKTSQLFSDSQYSKLTPEQLKNKYNEINKENSTTAAAEDLSNFVKAHPECDKNHYFISVK